MTFIGADDLLAAFRRTDPKHADVMRQLDVQGACSMTLTDVITFLREVTSPPHDAASIDAVNFVHWLVSDRGVHLDLLHVDVTHPGDGLPPALQPANADQAAARGP